MAHFELNKDAMSPVPWEEAASGPYVSQLEGFRQAWKAQATGSAQMGMTESLSKKDAEQARMLRDAGEIDAPVLSNDLSDWYLSRGVERPLFESGDYPDIYRYYGGEGTTPDIEKQIEEYDNRIEAMRLKYPNMKLRTSRDMFDETVSEGREAERVLGASRGGNVGKFIGGAVSSMNPRTDPLNFSTMAIGGAGKNLAIRVAGQMGAQGVIESLNQVFGVQEQRKIMGMSYGAVDAVERVGMAAVGGGLMQGVGEGTGAIIKAGRRWFNDSKGDPAPKFEPAQSIPTRTPEMQAKFNNDVRVALSGMHPLSATPEGRGRLTADLDYIKSKLEAWDGGRPFDIKPPKSDTRLPHNMEAFEPSRISVATHNNIDIRARQIDPKTFAVFDKLSERKVELRDQLDRIKPDTIVLQEKVNDLSDRIDVLREKLQRNVANKSKRAPATKKRLDAAISERGTLLRQIEGQDTPPMRVLRNELMHTDYKMRDAAPLVTRAYAQAKGDWVARGSYLDGIKEMIRSGSREVPPRDVGALTDLDPDIVFRNQPVVSPMPRRSIDVDSKMRDDADALHYTQAIVDEEGKVLGEAIESFRAGVSGAIKKDAKEVTLTGHDKPIRLDEDIVTTNKDGSGERTTTVRKLLQEQLEAEEDLKAVTVCST